MRQLPILLLLLAPPALANGLAAPQVIVRGRQTLDEALAVALRPIASRPVPVAIVVDVTPYTADEQEGIHAALRRLEPTFPHVPHWRIGRLGGPLSPAEPGPGDLGAHFGRVFSEPTETDSTIAALARTVSGFGDSGGAILYLADWHFEDEERLEEFIHGLLGRRQALSVIGSEAAFGRAFNDGFFPPHRGRRGAGGRSVLYDERVGRAPFGGARDQAPYHGGDSAWPHLPFHFHSADWSARFPAEREPVPTWEDHVRRRYAERAGDGDVREGPMEDVRERLGPDAIDPDALERYSFPLPSGFGPYGLMRAAGVTGGRYVLWSFNPEGRSTVSYEYGRLDLFAPDLRPRAEILDDLRRRPQARALLEAWHLVANEKLRIACTTPPLDRRSLRPTDMVEARGHALAYSWHEPGDHARFLALAETTLRALGDAVAVLERARERGTTDPVGRRYQADLELFRHALLVQRFCLGEALAAAKRLPRGAWRDPDLIPVLDSVTFIRSEVVEGAVETELVELFDKEAGSRLLAERKWILERYRGTPVAEMVARNSAATYEIDWRPTGKGRPARGAPADSTDEPGPVTPPGSGSGGTGPSTR